ncbi:MAG: hypothetical protein ACLQPH_03200 [Acidimicrobiales bacterium]
MEGAITDRDRTTMLRAAVARVGRDEMKAALLRTSDPSFRPPKVVANALNALRKHRDPVAVVGNPQYRAALPYVAAVVSDECLSRTIEALGDSSEDPTREELLEALDQVRGEFSGVTIGVMLASVAEGDMSASDLCFEIAATDERYGLTAWAEPDSSINAARTSAGPEEAPSAGSPPAAPPAAPTEAPTGTPAASLGAPAAPEPPASSGTTREQREARRLKKRRDAEARRRELEAKRRAAEQVRHARKKERAASVAGGRPTAEQGAEHGSEKKERGSEIAQQGSQNNGSPRRTATPLIRRAVLTPMQEQEFDPDDPWVSGVVFAWIPFTSTDPVQPNVDGKSRRCVVVAGSPTHLLVRPGYSEGGVKSRDWKSVALRHWKRAGFDQPTWVDIESFRVPRQPESAPIGWISPEDWNELW